MKGTKLLLSFWLSTAAFCLLQILFGPGGLTEMAQLQRQQVRVEARLGELKDENRSLTARYESLRTSTEAVRLEARALGYFQPGETPVRILDGTGFRLPSEEPDLSVVPSLAADEGVTPVFFRAAWILLFSVFYVSFHLWTLVRPSQNPWSQLVRTGGANLRVPLQTGLDFFRK